MGGGKSWEGRGILLTSFMGGVPGTEKPLEMSVKNEKPHENSAKTEKPHKNSLKLQ